MMQPFQIEVNLQTGAFLSGNKPTQRRLKDMVRIFSDTAAMNELLPTEANRLIYEFYAADLPEQEGHVIYGTTVIYPGKVGGEYHMTKGHYHEKRDRGEVYFGLAGSGMLVMQTEAGEVSALAMTAGTAAYVPPYWAHRTVNVGTDPFVFFAAWPGDAGHDYATIEHKGFAQIVVEDDGKPVLVDNPRYK